MEAIKGKSVSCVDFYVFVMYFDRSQSSDQR